MSKNEFICDCNIIHENIVKDTLSKMPEDDFICFRPKRNVCM